MVGEEMLNLIPIPKKCIEHEGAFVLPEVIKIQSEFDLPLLEGKAELTDSSNITIKKDDSIHPEGYRLTVTADEISITASTKTGAYYALVTIWKISSFQLGGREVPCVEIEDEPRMKWRGLQIDESRHFFGMDVIKKMLDNMFLEKLNVFHWHLTDDQGWRIEIKKYPLLTEKGSYRSYTHIGGWSSLKIDNTPHSGFYTQEQIKEIIEYARERGIMIVPEIDFPAHCAAALTQYKWLGCREIDTEVPGYFGGIIPQWKHFNWRWNRTLCCGKESTFEFIFNVLDEVCELFDAPYIHMGGDEAPTDEWHRCPECQRVIKENGLKNERALQGWFENRILEYLNTKNKKLIGWNEILSADNINISDNNVVVQYWTPKKDPNAQRYANEGGEIILSNHQHFYFDMTYAQIPLDKTYSYSPELFGIDSNNTDNILGYEGELWSEWIADEEKLQLQAFPRMQALGELCWSPKNQLVYRDFKKRLDMYKPVLDSMGVNYAVDRVSLPSNKHDITKIRLKFQKGNPYLETELNKEYKAKGDK